MGHAPVIRGCMRSRPALVQGYETGGEVGNEAGYKARYKAGYKAGRHGYRHCGVCSEWDMAGCEARCEARCYEAG